MAVIVVRVAARILGRCTFGCFFLLVRSDGAHHTVEFAVCTGQDVLSDANAFEAARFIIDFLKTEAPFWKKEITSNGDYWVEDKDSDYQQKMSWSRTEEKS